MEDLPKTGRRRLGILLSVVGGLACLLAMTMFVFLYGAPYNPMWWWVMGAIAVAAFALAPLFAVPIEWVVRGYRQDDPR